MRTVAGHCEGRWEHRRKWEEATGPRELMDCFLPCRGASGWLYQIMIRIERGHRPHQGSRTRDRRKPGLNCPAPGSATWPTASTGPTRSAPAAVWSASTGSSPPPMSPTTARRHLDLHRHGFSYPAAEVFFGIATIARRRASRSAASVSATLDPCKSSANSGLRRLIVSQTHHQGISASVFTDTRTVCLST